MANRSGTYRRNLSGDAAYLSFVPAKLPPKPAIVLSSEMVDLLVRAHSQLALLSALSGQIPSMELFVSMYVRKEALLSAQIEGTQATLEDVLDPRAEANINRNVVDVVNYIKAVEYALERVNTLPLSNRLLRETHAILMEDVRGQEKTPGAFRTTQNWIGGQGSVLRNARYIPPNPEDMQRAMSDLERYLHATEPQDVLVRVALVHYQFETIHPFLDGNGRLGRLLIILQLVVEGVLASPSLYPSYFLKRNRTEYYDRLTMVREKGDYEQWVRFFLEAVLASAEDAIDTVRQLSALHTDNVRRIDLLGRAAASTQTVFRYLEAHPIISIRQTAEDLQLSYGTVNACIERLIGIGILHQNNRGAERNRVFSYGAYLDILRAGT